ncbi:hypothetical protein [Streptomyces sp. NBC_01198]|nr:hypothetical protein OG702_17035 [Streptomyces sp. NBC_01198]
MTAFITEPHHWQALFVLLAAGTCPPAIWSSRPSSPSPAWAS